MNPRKLGHGFRMIRVGIPYASPRSDFFASNFAGLRELGFGASGFSSREFGA